MEKYIVHVKEVCSQQIEVDALSESDAIERALEGEGESLGPVEYEYTLDRDTWKVHKKEKEKE